MEFCCGIVRMVLIERIGKPMSRSKRKTPKGGNTTARSEKDEKRIINRSLRRQTRVLLKQLDDDTLFPIQNDVMDKWSMAKDGKTWFKGWKDYKKLMRK
jgi:hypothetical protein